MATERDQLIDQLLIKVEEKKAEVEKIKNPVFKTNLSASNPLIGDGAIRINLNVASEEALLSLLYSFEFLIEQNKKVPSKYGISGITEWNGFKLEDWRDDIVLKIKQKNSQKQIKELKEMEAKLNSLMSEDKKKDLELEALKNSLGL